MPDCVLLHSASTHATYPAMKPVVVLVGRPNVGKSTLFNRLTATRAALVADLPGLTRDRLYGAGVVGDRPYWVVDTGGLSKWSAASGGTTLEALASAQVRQAILEADAVILLTDGKEGVTAADREVAEGLRRQGVLVRVAVNKSEGLEPVIATAEFHALGLGEPVAISALRGDGVKELMRQVLEPLPRVVDQAENAEIPVIAVVGRPNVGKSTLVNALLRAERVLVFEEPGTTRDSVRVALERLGRRYVLIDTAGVRRRPRVVDTIEKFSVVKTLQAIEEANVVILVLDARAGISEQDAALAGFILEQGRAIVVAVNKCDGLDAVRRREVKHELERKLSFLTFTRTHLISARAKTGLASLFASVDRAFASARKRLSTPMLNRLLQQAVQAMAPPRGRTGPVHLKFAHQGGRNPPLVVIHGTRVGTVARSYRRYLANAMRAGFRLEGTPVRIELREGENPFALETKTRIRREKTGLARRHRRGRPGRRGPLRA
jgi:GTP-binding protein